jgi:hypothetical protein
MIKKQKKDIWNQIKKWQDDSEFVRQAYEFIRIHTGHSPRQQYFKR